MFLFIITWEKQEFSYLQLSLCPALFVLFSVALEEYVHSTYVHNKVIKKKH